MASYGRAVGCKEFARPTCAAAQRKAKGPNRKTDDPCGSALEVSAAAAEAGEPRRGGARGVWSLDDAAGVVEVARTSGGRVAIRRGRATQR